MLMIWQAHFVRHCSMQESSYSQALLMAYRAAQLARGGLFPSDNLSLYGRPPSLAQAKGCRAKQLPDSMLYLTRQQFQKSRLPHRQARAEVCYHVPESLLRLAAG